MCDRRSAFCKRPSTTSAPWSHRWRRPAYVLHRVGATCGYRTLAPQGIWASVVLMPTKTRTMTPTAPMAMMRGPGVSSFFPRSKTYERRTPCHWLHDKRLKPRDGFGAASTMTVNHHIETRCMLHAVNRMRRGRWLPSPQQMGHVPQQRQTSSVPHSADGMKHNCRCYTHKWRTCTRSSPHERRSHCFRQPTLSRRTVRAWRRVSG